MKLPGALRGPLVSAGSLVLRLLCMSLRFRIQDTAGFTFVPPVTPSICVLWHNRILVMPYFRERYAGAVQASVLTSASRDGNILTQVVGHFSLGAVRGSSSKRGAAAVRELSGRIRRGETIAVTPDGPRGPVYGFKPGALHLAIETGAPLFLYGVKYSRYVALKSWDGFQIPLPFSRVDVRIKLPELEDLQANSFEETVQILEQEMNALNVGTSRPKFRKYFTRHRDPENPTCQ